MASLNSVTLIGLLGRDPEEVHAGQSRFARLSVATDDGYRDQSGQKVERTTWHSVASGGKTADFVLKYLHKGARSSWRAGISLGSTRPRTAATPCPGTCRRSGCSPSTPPTTTDSRGTSREAVMMTRGSTSGKAPTEHEEQAALIEWWGLYARWKSLPPSLLMAIPNGGYRSAITGARLKAEGVRVGILTSSSLCRPDRHTAFGSR